MNNRKASFYGYNDGKAIRIHNCINLFLPTVISIITSLALSLLSYLLHNPYLLVIWVLPIILLLAYVLCFVFEAYDDRVFLAGTKKKHPFIVDSGILLRDGKPIKKDGIRVYTFKNFVFLVCKKTYYRVPNEDFIGISREDFLQFMKSKN